MPTDDNFTFLTERNGWSIARAQGYVAGETYRRTGKPPLRYALVGIDDYAAGFRAGYFERRALGRRRPVDNDPSVQARG